ncbi:heavy metal translocating P-type ATPase [Halalkalibacter hemicellulosilyticus]|uniref:Cd(2+)-exporting ATPase n=1 Tax=Halalkalibacter hemicellulosilyticusJCM 9152 TaxID=1236971 RepID=W4QJN4_9BACI|nr:heavy metal translocating P-type ATPase [Halalkalibacter hemicellulosilyticus]GAE31838.1 lead, cadmium, zinc and mercury transporting ATPase [Halalkalibacter hemicellulosilyticusJCM 9152]
MKTDEQRFHVQGLSCADCSAQFEKNVRGLPGVREAKVHFATAKLSVYGDVSIEELEQAGSFDQLKVTAENEELLRTPLWKQKGAIQTFLSGVLLIVGLALYVGISEDAYWAILLFALSIVIGGYRLFIQGIKNIFGLQFDMKALMTIAIIGAVFIGEWAEGAAVVFFFSISEWLEMYSMDRARKSIRSLMGMAPKKALIKKDGEWVETKVDEVVVGDIMFVKPGDKVALDGIVIKGISTINQAPITGESIPVVKEVGHDVFAGTLNEDGMLEVEVTKKKEDTTITKIIHLVEDAQAKRAPAQAFVDRFAKYYTPIVIMIALMVAVIPPLIVSGSWNEWVYRGLALLVVACPCALIISTPVSIVTAIGTAARNGVLVKGGMYLEALSSLTSIAFDKTGTLTKGQPEVTDVVSFQERENWFQIVAEIERGSQHPLAKAIVRKAEQNGNDNKRLYDVSEFKSITGKGIQATVNEQRYWIGNVEFIKENCQEVVEDKVSQHITRLQQEGKTVVIVTDGNELLGAIAVRDEVRKSSEKSLHQLKQLGLEKMVMLTGDHRSTASGIAKQLGGIEVKAELLPEDKLHVIRTLKESGGRIAMVGDGINDAPALATANVGIAMGGAGTDTALETADIALMADDIEKIPFMIRLSRKTLAIIKQNIVFSLMIKLVAILLIMIGWLPLWLAIVADVGATLLVTMNGLRLARLKEY